MRIVLAHSSSHPEAFLRTFRYGKEPAQWLFLGQEYVQFLKWEKALDRQARCIQLKPGLTNIIEQLRQPYLDLTEAMNKQNNSPAWWASRISERNTAVSHLFLHCCYLRFADQALAGSAAVTLGIVSESQAVLESISLLAKQKNIETVWAGKRAKWFGKLRSWVKGLFWISIYAAVGIRARLAGHDTSPNTKTARSIFIHTYIDESCFGPDGVFRDRYFPGLYNWLDEQGYAVSIIPVIFNIKRSYRSAWKWLRSSGKTFINPYRYYRVSDYLFAIRTSWKQLSMLKERVLLDGMDVTQLFKAEQDHWAFRDIGSILYFRLPKRLSKAGLRIDMMIAEYENMINEKMLILGFHTYLPSVKFVGFQHGALYPFLLCNFVTPAEAAFAPLPDRVVCNGELFRNILTHEGLPEGRAVVGPALRYAYLTDTTARADSGAVGGPGDIFVPLPMMISDGAELLTKLLKAFGDMDTFRLKLKPHPMTNAEILLKAAAISKLPSHFECVQGSIGDWLQSAKIAIALSSSAIYDIVASGVPVVVVGRDAGVDLNPLGFLDDLNKVFYTPEDIRKEALRLASLSQGELDRYRKRGKEVLRMSFNPITDASMRVFVEGLV